MVLRGLAVALGIFGWLIEFVGFFVCAIVFLADRKRATSLRTFVTSILVLLISGLAGPGVIVWWIYLETQVARF